MYDAKFILYQLHNVASIHQTPLQLFTPMALFKHEWRMGEGRTGSTQVVSGLVKFLKEIMFTYLLYFIKTNKQKQAW